MKESENGSETTNGVGLQIFEILRIVILVVFTHSFLVETPLPEFT